MRNEPTIDQVTDAVLAASRVLVAISARSLADVTDDVTLAQYRTLVVLQSRGPQSLQALAAELQVVPSTATRMCDRLVAKALITRAAVAGNRREIELAVTDQGAALVSSVTRRRRRDIRRAVARMASANRGALVSALEDFATAAGEVPEDQWFLGWT